MAKKKTKKPKKNKRDDVDVKIKVKNLDKVVKGAKKNKCKTNWHKGCGGCWAFGSALAMILSYTQNSSILWAILHGVISWFYVLYRIVVDYALFG